MDTPRTIFYRLQEIFKNHHHNTFLVYFNLVLKRNHTDFYLIESLCYNITSKKLQEIIWVAA